MKYTLLLLFYIVTLNTTAQHTFSIIAIDPLTYEVGGAGATCYQTVNDIADVHPGIGYIHTQSYMNASNQAMAQELMNKHFAPQTIIDSLQKIDAEHKPELRQYAVIDLANGGRTAAFTGDSCFDYKGARIGKTYVIIGNILAGPHILDAMESGYLTTEGSLSDKLMAALQAAKVPGADKRCTEKKVSSLSAYMIVAKPQDTPAQYFLNLNIENVYPQDPIDVLQTNYNKWKQQNKH